MTDLNSITALLVQTGSLGLVALVMLLGIYFGIHIWREVKQELREMRAALLWFGSVLVDHKRKAGDTSTTTNPPYADPDRSSPHLPRQ